MYPTLQEKEQVINALKGPQFDRENHGSLFDRGSADSYYGRYAQPHWYPEGSYNGDPVTKLTQAEIDEYLAGYEWNELHGHKKSWD
jgi:hypothetical protein